MHTYHFSHWHPQGAIAQESTLVSEKRERQEQTVSLCVYIPSNNLAAGLHVVNTRSLITFRIGPRNWDDSIRKIYMAFVTLTFLDNITSEDYGLHSLHGVHHQGSCTSFIFRKVESPTSLLPGSRESVECSGMQSFRFSSTYNPLISLC